MFASADTGIYPHVAPPSGPRGILMLRVDKFLYLVSKQEVGNDITICHLPASYYTL